MPKKESQGAKMVEDAKAEPRSSPRKTKKDLGTIKEDDMITSPSPKKRPMSNISKAVKLVRAPSFRGRAESYEMADGGIGIDEDAEVADEENENEVFHAARLVRAGSKVLDAVKTPVFRGRGESYQLADGGLGVDEGAEVDDAEELQFPLIKAGGKVLEYMAIGKEPKGVDYIDTLNTSLSGAFGTGGAYDAEDITEARRRANSREEDDEQPRKMSRSGSMSLTTPSLKGRSESYDLADGGLGMEEDAEPVIVDDAPPRSRRSSSVTERLSAAGSALLSMIQTPSLIKKGMERAESFDLADGGLGLGK